MTDSGNTRIRARLAPLMLAHLDALILRGRERTAETTAEVLDQFHRWVVARRLDPLAATTADLEAYQDHLLTTYRTPHGKLLARSTVSMRIAVLMGWYAWLTDRGDLVVDPARSLGVRVQSSRVVIHDPLTLHEVTALLQTAAAAVAACPAGTPRHAAALRDLAALCLALATGRRVGGVAALTVAHVDCDRRELRVDREKGHVGRVLPVCGWAMEVIALYLRDARPFLTRGHDAPWLFLDLAGTGPIARQSLRRCLRSLLVETIHANPDLRDLPGKRVCWHSLRVSFATLLFQNGCDIRSVNELLLHRRLSTTARYTPTGVEDLRQAFRGVHPRP